MAYYCTTWSKLGEFHLILNKLLCDEIDCPSDCPTDCLRRQTNHDSADACVQVAVKLQLSYLMHIFISFDRAALYY